jgi:hypothetical protein
MKQRVLGGVFAATALGALMIAPAVAAAPAAIAAVPLGVAHQQPPPPGSGGDSRWGGFNRLGWVNPADPFHNDWHCDRHGYWHHDQFDRWGRPDRRCHRW